MAIQTRFDLNSAVENWRNELAAQPQLTSDDRRELEKHLADTMAELRQRGLNEEESFWLARRRIGQPQQLGEEFEKTDPAKIWRDRVFWMALAFLVFLAWAALLDIIPFHRAQVIYVCLLYLPPICFAVLLAKGKLTMNYPSLEKVFKVRWIFAGSAICFVLSTFGIQTWESYNFLMQSTIRHALPPLFWLNQIQMVGFPLMIVGVAVWLLPAQKRSTKVPS